MGYTQSEAKKKRRDKTRKRGQRAEGIRERAEGRERGTTLCETLGKTEGG